jgi:hypothetical protein
MANSLEPVEVGGSWSSGAVHWQSMQALCFMWPKVLWSGMHLIINQDWFARVG